MKYIFNKLYSSFTALTVLVLLALVVVSCEHKDLYLRQSHKQLVNVRFDWSQLRAGDLRPEGMSLFFYDDMSGEMHRYDLSTSSDVHTIEVFSGFYGLICYDSDNSAVSARNQSDKELHDIVVSGSNVQAPVLYGVNSDVEVEYREDGSTEPNQVITITPVFIPSTYTVIAKNIKAVANAVAWNAKLMGLTNSMYVYSGNCSNNASETYVSFPLVVSDNGTSCSNAIRTFGQLHNTSVPDPVNKLLIRVHKSDSSIVYYLFDVTNQVSGASDRRNVTITVDMSNGKLVAPGDPDFPGDDPDYVSGGLDAGVDEFGNEDFDVNM